MCELLGMSARYPTDLALNDGEIIRTLTTRGKTAPQAWKRRREQARLEAEYQSRIQPERSSPDAQELDAYHQ